MSDDEHEPAPELDAGSFDDPVALAAIVAAAPAPRLIGLDVDGVLAPIVARAGDARLLPGVLDAVVALAARTPVAIVSGRRLNDLRSFGFDPPIEVFGTHGLERLGAAPVALTADEEARAQRLRTIADEAVDLAGEGAWVEFKPAGFVLHVREADPAAAARATEAALRASGEVDGAHVKPGKAVVEMLVRPTSKATAVRTVRDEVGAATVVFVGDDHTDEEVFHSMDAGDIAIHVGGGATVAPHRLADPHAVLAFLQALAATI